MSDIKKRYEQRLRESGQDMGAILRQAQKDLAAQQRFERRIAEVDGREYQTPILDIPLLAVENSAGYWVLSTTTTVYPSQKGEIRAVHRNKNIAICDFRQTLKERLIDDRHTRDQEEARRMAALAKVWLSAEVPYARIVSK